MKYNNESVHISNDETTITEIYILLFSTLKTNPINEMLDQPKPIVNNLYITEFDFPKASPKETI